MTKHGLNQPQFKDTTSARKYLERLRWPSGPVCPHCGGMEKAYQIKGKSTRPGLWKCGHCRKQFSVTVGTLFERSKIPLHDWLKAVYLLCSSKKGISSHQLHRLLGVTYKTAWFMSHRIREAMSDPVFKEKLGGPGKTVEADETYWGKKFKKHPKARGTAHKEKIFSLVERGGSVRSHHVQRVSGETLKPIIRDQVEKETHLMTDDFGAYKDLGNEFHKHSVVCHSRGEYVRGPIYTNTIEGYFSILKRGLRGVYQHVKGKHLKRYIGEFDFRYNNRTITDAERADVALIGIGGKRLLYRDS